MTFILDEQMWILTGSVLSIKPLTIHLILNENSVLKAKIPQMTGQTISPSQKIRDSESDAWCFPVPWRKQDILTVTTSVNTIMDTDSEQMHLSNSYSPRGQHHVRLKASHDKLDKLLQPETTESRETFYLPRLKHPTALPIVVHLVPPPQTNHQPPCDVLETKIDISTQWKRKYSSVSASTVVLTVKLKFWT